MYNGIGLTTPRGSGTNGYVIRNLSVLRTHQTAAERAAAWDVAPPKHREPDAEILEHERKRKVEVKCLELQLELEDKGLDEDKIEQEVDALRQKLLANLGNMAPDIRSLKPSDRHGIAAAKKEELSKMARALGTRSDYTEGEAFDREKQEESKIRRAAEREERDRQRDEERAKIQEQKEKWEAEKRERERLRRREEDRRRKEREEGMKRERICETDGVAVQGEMAPLLATGIMDATPEEVPPHLARLHLLLLVGDAHLRDLPLLHLVHVVASARGHPRRHAIVVPARSSHLLVPPVACQVHPLPIHIAASPFTPVQAALAVTVSLPFPIPHA
ncbi:hypothetical protein PHLGIDRAFT_126482 [Phlebiopsis gigantea 11061_1 CR5-6]|uniref:CWF21 domain-containing protein n=1 Tax=Phlebiopsis gigantea (strain 11061_1 CR5-6) TaxID=745531 RepID=A0A0C3SAG1_PHLG1|nr:hypothetical protein PHLGIDRAFT_126482 [Phlebiopsis gigantea 11061_1 CR5-6]